MALIVIYVLWLRLTGLFQAEFMQKMTHWRGGTTVLGIIFSLPFALLIWASVEFVLLMHINVLIAWYSMISFALALLYIIFQATNPASLSVMILGTVMVTSVVMLPIWWGRNYGSYAKWFSILKGIFQQNSTGDHDLV